MIRLFIGLAIAFAALVVAPSVTLARGDGKTCNSEECKQRRWRHSREEFLNGKPKLRKEDFTDQRKRVTSKCGPGYNWNKKEERCILREKE